MTQRLYTYSKLALFLLVLTIYGNQPYAACLTTTITATTPTADFVLDNVNGTATHNKTGLMWKRCPEGATWNGTTCTGAATGAAWGAALNSIITVNTNGFAGFNDWRMPNIKELRSIIERQCSAPAINVAVFPTVATTRFWTSTAFLGLAGTENNFVIGIDFTAPNNFELQMDKVTFTGGVLRLVRGGT